MCAANEYVGTLFAPEPNEADGSIPVAMELVTVADVNGDALKQLVEFCYTGRITIHEGNIGDVVKAATMLRFTAVADNCIEYYLSILCIANCLDIDEVADAYDLARLKVATHTFIVDNFIDVSRSDGFLELVEKRLSPFLVDNEINVVTEEDVFQAVVRWIKYDVETRAPVMGALLECVRFKLFPVTVSQYQIESSFVF